MQVNMEKRQNPFAWLWQIWATKMRRERSRQAYLSKCGRGSLSHGVIPMITCDLQVRTRRSIVQRSILRLHAALQAVALVIVGLMRESSMLMPCVWVAWHMLCSKYCLNSAWGFGELHIQADVMCHVCPV